MAMKALLVLVEVVREMVVQVLSLLVAVGHDRAVLALEELLVVVVVQTMAVLVRVVEVLAAQNQRKMEA